MTIFAKIIAGEIPANVVYEDDTFLAFLDVNPATLGHTLVIPKKEFRDFTEVPADLLGAYFATVQKVAASLVDVCNADAFKVLTNVGAVAGQSVFHVHVHIIPMYANQEFPALGAGWKSQPELHAGDHGVQLAEKVFQSLS